MDTARPCYSAVGTHPTEMLSCYLNAINRNSILQIKITHKSTYSTTTVYLRQSCTLEMVVDGKRNSTFSMTVKNNHFVGVEVKIKSSTTFVSGVHAIYKTDKNKSSFFFYSCKNKEK